MHSGPRTWISHLGNAMPGRALAQSAIADWMEPRLADGADRRRFRRFSDRMGISVRHSVLDLFGDEGDEFYPRSGPGADATVRSHAFGRYALPLALAAVERACPGRVGLDGITHLIVATCTGAVAPGLDVQLARALGLSPRIKRTVVGFMGCYAAIPALRAAWEACRADPTAKALVVCCELSSLHFQPGPTVDDLLGACLFADGAAAAVVESGDAPVGLGLAITAQESLLIPDSDGLMAWQAGPRGFLLRLSPEVAPRLTASIDELMANLLGDRPAARWCIHPGGPKVIDAMQERLDLDDALVAGSRAVLANGGNRSSATVLAILAGELDEEWTGCAPLIAFGPGLTADALLVERVR